MCRPTPWSFNAGVRRLLSARAEAPPAAGGRMKAMGPERCDLGGLSLEFRDLKTQYKVLETELDAAVKSVMRDANYISGAPVSRLEKELADYAGVKHCVTCGNGTDALAAALMALGIGPGDAVFVPDFTFFASAEAPAFVGATPVLVDIDPDTYNLSPDSLERAVELIGREGRLRPAAVIAVDLFGLPADYDAIRRITDRRHIFLIEDGAQGFGGVYRGRRACSFGDISTTSFFPAKPLGCYGDGGAIFTDNSEYDRLLRSICVHGKGSDKYHNVRIGMNSRLDTLQAAVLLVKLKAFRENELDLVNRVARMYHERLPAELKKPEVPEGCLSSWAQYTIRLDKEPQRDRLMDALKRDGIPSMVYYPVLMHEQPALCKICRKVDTPAAEEARGQVLSLPIGPYVRETEVDCICGRVRDFLSHEKEYAKEADGDTEIGPSGNPVCEKKPGRG